MKKRLTAIYTSSKELTGQLLATQMLLQLLREEGWSVRELRLPAFNRKAHSRSLAIIAYLFQLIFAWLKIPFYLFPRADHIYLNMGQSNVALIRDLVPFRILKAFARSGSHVSLHGSIFMGWGQNSRSTRLFRMLAQSASHITVLGPNQKNKLIELGFQEERIVILPNACSVQPLEAQAAEAKQQSAATLKILFLSNLIETKGFPEFLEGMELLAKRTTVPIEVVLCGPLMKSESEERFTSLEQTRTWIEQKIAALNAYPLVSAQWIKGAFGKDKDTLLHDTHLFIFPSRYAVEAQPIVLIEAMASGAAVITSKAGEIPTTVRDAAVLLAEVTPEAIAQAASLLTTDKAERIKYALKGISLFNEVYTLRQHKKNWLKLLK